jgi:hypothetical protein
MITINLMLVFIDSVKIVWCCEWSVMHLVIYLL